MKKNPKLFLSLLILTVLIGLAAMVEFFLIKEKAEAYEKPTPLISTYVKVIKPVKKDLYRTITLTGEVMAYQKVTLYSRASGYLKEIHFDRGTEVKKGDLLAVIDVPEVKQKLLRKKMELQKEKARQEEISHKIIQAEKRILGATSLYKILQIQLKRSQTEHKSALEVLKIRENLFKRIEGLQKKSPNLVLQDRVDQARERLELAQRAASIAAIEIEEGREKVELEKFSIEKAKAFLSVLQAGLKVQDAAIRELEREVERVKILVSFSEIRSPFDGVIKERLVHPGDMIFSSSSKSTPLGTLVDSSRVRVLVYVPEEEALWLKSGSSKSNPVEISIPRRSEKSISSQLTRLSWALEKESKTMAAEIELSKKRGILRPGMYVQVKIGLERYEEALSLPSSALLVDGKNTYVYTVEGDKVQKRKIVIGIDDGVYTQITDGLSGKETVIVSGKDAVHEGMSVSSLFEEGGN